MIDNSSMKEFIDAVSMKQPTPGGGGAAAVSGAMGAALVSMVANFTIDKKGYEEHWVKARKALEESEAVRQELMRGVQEDVDVFNAVMDAYRMPKETEMEKDAKKKALQAALKQATEVPLKCARQCRQVMELSGFVAEWGNSMVISDAGVGVCTAYAGLRSAFLNGEINMAGIEDEDFAADRRRQFLELIDGSQEFCDKVYDLVRGRLA
ncbi:MAG: cyclodeaminase/cyclohydrolase family protein [Candidatus Eutrophobiaceae bacterium]